MDDMRSVTAAGGVLFKAEGEETEVLLIFRRGVWDLPKGKKEPDETVDECARREVSEEVGCPPPEVCDRIATSYHEYEEKGERIGKTTVWYAMKTSIRSEFQPEKQEGISEIRWFSLKEALEHVGYDNLKSVLRKFGSWYKRIDKNR